jgi:hypothetical protein
MPKIPFWDFGFILENLGIGVNIWSFGEIYGVIKSNYIYFVVFWYISIRNGI